MSNATLLSSPASPASAYRPLEYRVQGRGVGSLYVVGSVTIADASDVTALGAPLVVGDVLIEHAGVPAEVGDTVYVEGCGSYNGLWTVAKVIVDTGSPQYLTITAPDYGDVTPGSGNIIAWPEGYTVYAEVSIYTDPAAPPTKVRMRGTPDLQGVATFPVNTVVKDYFASDISAFALPIVGGGVTQDAHGVTALFYTTRFVEAWQDDPLIDPWDGTHEIDEDADYRTAVNAVHPYCSDLTTWETDDMELFVCDTAETGRKFLTNAPRTLTLADSDHFRLFFLLADPWNGHFTIRVNSLSSSGVPTGEVIAENVDLGHESAAMCIAVGPADLSPLISVPTNYRVFVSNNDGDQVSEYFYFTVDTKCKEVRRPMAALNSLGGIDLFTFTGREIQTERAKRATVRKPYSSGTGFDYMERTYRNEPNASFLLSSGLLTNANRKWVTQLFMRSSNVVCRLSNTQAATVVLLSDAAEAYNTGGATKPVTIEYRLGVDGIAQNA